MATIREIAELAGVSRGTVDRVLNGRGSVNEKTAQKVYEIARALNYRPNPAGLALAAQKKQLRLGVISGASDNPFFAQILENLNAKAKELSCYNCSVLIRQVAFDARIQEDAIDALLTEGIHGLALSPVNVPSIRAKIDQLVEAGIPVITFNTDLRNSKRLSYVGSDFFHAGETAAGLMRLMTHGEIQAGIVTGSLDVLCHTERIAGFTQTLSRNCPRIRIADTVYCHDDNIETYEQTQRLLERHPQINALFFAAGGVYGGCRAVQALGLSGKLPIICFDAVPITCSLIQEGTICAAIGQHPEIQGRKPLELLFNYLTSGELPEREYFYTDADIRIRENIQYTSDFGGYL